MSIIDSEHVLKPRIELFKLVFDTKKKKLADLEIALWDQLGKVQVTTLDDGLVVSIPIQEKETKVKLVDDLLRRNENI